MGVFSGHDGHENRGHVICLGLMGRCVVCEVFELDLVCVDSLSFVAGGDVFQVVLGMVNGCLYLGLGCT